MLGPLEVLADGQPLELGPPLQRAVLAALLLARNQVVSTDALIDALWDEPPDSAANAVQVYVSHLRRALGKDRVRTRPPGYLLHVGPGELDLERFEQHRADGQIEDALALWRGPPLADLAHLPFAKAEIARFEELRLGCVEKRIGRALDDGRAPDVVSELESLVTDHPFREDLRRQLMLALYRSGRQVEALDAYHDARRVLVAELGIEPGRRLRELHQQILAQDAALESAPPHGGDEVGAGSSARRRQAPTGVLTFLMADVEGPSTSLWDHDHTAVVAALARVDELLSRAVEPHGGLFLASASDSGTTVSVFESATAAVRAAIDAAWALAAVTWPDGSPIRARFGLHSGEAQLDDGGYRGTTVMRTARICAAADAGELLLSEATAALVAATLPEDYTLVELGPFHLDGIPREETIKAVVGPGLATSQAAGACPYRGLLAFGPDDRHLFFGREDVLADVLARIAPDRILLVAGASGSGKSSLLRAGVFAAVREGELASVRLVRLITPGLDPPLGLDDHERELLIVDQFEELYSQCRDPARRARFIDELLSRRGPVVIGLRADFYGELGADARLAAAVATNQVLLGPMSDDAVRRAITEPARLAGLRLQHGLVDVVLRDVRGEPGALPLMSHALRETWQRRKSRTLTIEGYEESGGVSSALAQSADAVGDRTPPSDRPLLRNVFVRLTEVGDDLEDTRRRVPVEELIPEGSSEGAVRTLLERLVEARLVVLDGGTAEVAHEVLIRRWPTLRRWLDEDREGLRLHRRLGDAARLWDASGREPADLYRGTRLDAALEWAAHNRGLLNGTEREFLEVSAEESARVHRRQGLINRRLRRALVASAALFAATASLLGWALVQRSSAIHSTRVATSLALASDSTSLVGSNLGNSLLLALSAYGADSTEAARTAVTLALQGARSSGVDAILRSCGEVNDVAFGPGNGALAVGCYDGTTVLWDVSGGERRRVPVTLRPPGSCNRIRGVAFAGAGNPTLAVGCYDGNAALWGLAAGEPRGNPVTLSRGDSCTAVNTVAFGAGGVLAVACNNGNTILWHVAAGRPRGESTTLTGGSSCDSANDVAFAPGGRTLAVGCDNGGTMIWPLAAGRPDGRPETLRRASCDTVNGVAFGERGGMLAAGCNNGNTLLWPIVAGRSRGEPVTLAPSAGCSEVDAVAFGLRGGPLAVGCANGNTMLWDAAASGPGDAPVTLTGGSSCDAVDGLALDDDGTSLAVGCGNGNTLVFKHLAASGLRGDPDTLSGRGRCDAVNAVAFQPGGSTLAAACDNGNTVLRRIASGKPNGEALTLTGAPSCSKAVAVAFAPVGLKLAVGCANGNTVLWRVAAGRPRGDPVTLPGRGVCTNALAVAVGAGGGTLAVGCANGKTILWRLAASNRRATPTDVLGGKSCDLVYGLSFSPDGRTLAVGCYDGNTVLWKLAGGRPRGGPTTLALGNSCDAVYGVAFARDGQTLAVGCHNGDTVLWGIEGGEPHGAPVTLPPTSGCDPLLGVAFGAGGTLAVSCADGRAVLWDVSKEKARGGPVTLPPSGGCANVYGVAFESGGRTLALGCSDGDTQLWDVVPWAASYATVQTRVCGFVWGDLTTAEWNTLAPGLSYQRPCRYS